MKKTIFFIMLMLLSTGVIFSQKVYDEKQDGDKALTQAIDKAKADNKYVFAMVGGNWCKWCLMFNDFALTNEKVKKTLDDNFIFIHINYSKGNENEKAMQRLGYPERFGFPVFVILNEKGERVHTQYSAYLEQGEGYSEKEVLFFLNNWTKQVVTNKSKKK
jgi:thioredoxin-related protein